MIVVTCRARKGKDQFSLREMVNSTRVVSTLVEEREGEKHQHGARRIKNSLNSQIRARQHETQSAPLAFVLFATL